MKPTLLDAKQYFMDWRTRWARQGQPTKRDFFIFLAEDSEYTSEHLVDLLLNTYTHMMGDPDVGYSRVFAQRVSYQFDESDDWQRSAEDRYMGDLALLIDVMR